MNDQIERKSIQPTGISTDVLINMIGVKEVELYVARQHIQDLQKQIKRLTEGGGALPPDEQRA